MGINNSYELLLKRIHSRLLFRRWVKGSRTWKEEPWRQTCLPTRKEEQRRKARKKPSQGMMRMKESKKKRRTSSGCEDKLDDCNILFYLPRISGKRVKQHEETLWFLKKHPVGWSNKPWWSRRWAFSLSLSLSRKAEDASWTRQSMIHDRLCFRSNQEVEG